MFVGSLFIQGAVRRIEDDQPRFERDSNNFSASGKNALAVAKAIAREAGVELAAITPAKEYAARTSMQSFACKGVAHRIFVWAA